VHSIACKSLRTDFDAFKAAHRVFADGAMATNTFVCGALVDIYVNTTNAVFLFIIKVV